MYTFFIVKSRNASIIFKIDNNNFEVNYFLRCLLIRFILQGFCNMLAFWKWHHYLVIDYNIYYPSTSLIILVDDITSEKCQQ